MSAPLSVERLAEIRARVEVATEGPWCTDAWEIYQGTEYVPGISHWVGETCQGAAGPEQDRADAAFVAGARSDVPALLAEVERLKLVAVLAEEDYRRMVRSACQVEERLRARVAELERPAIEAERNKVRDSFTELAAAAQKERDSQGAFNAYCDLREREEQWAREDAEAEVRSPEQGSFLQPWLDKLDAKSQDNFFGALALAADHEPASEAAAVVEQTVADWRALAEGGVSDGRV